MNGPFKQPMNAAFKHGIRSSLVHPRLWKGVGGSRGKGKVFIWIGKMKGELFFK